MPDIENSGIPGGEEPPKPPAGGEGTFTEKFSHSPIAARVPERVKGGVFSTGVLVQDGPGEFVVDFLQNLGRPPHIVARVILSPLTMHGLVSSLRENLGMYTKNFGPPPPLPKPPQQNRPSIQELYEHFKLPDELLSGMYANAFLIAHAPAEFVVDFITGFYPTASVSCRAYLAASQMPRLLDTLNQSLQQHEQRFGRTVMPPPPQPPPAQPDGGQTNFG
ncbi:MAG TPA: DUF3467 domain-containing protein [Tepidisphaeraceae bacterium]|nr:DUF3467 domain-containing protein [Tepidisphaeraceae bacterium]